MPNERLTWDEIEKSYDKQWVELVDYDWPDEDPYPRSGVLRSHHSDKKAFHQMARREPVPKHSAILFVGRPDIPENLYFSPSLIRVQPCDK